ncbi:MAG TPA: type II toxin-antitoxin system PemK/MazF family toxin [Sphingomonas sp.]|nr:type II toxin-antitoxin system PemK/MazF family toxin [Sphingomonas sp.]
MKRGDVVIAAERSRLGGKPRPWLVVQSDAFNPTHATLTLCMISASADQEGLFRVRVEPSQQNGLEQTSVVMIDVILSVGRRSIDKIAGRLDEETMMRIDEALLHWLDL